MPKYRIEWYTDRWVADSVIYDKEEDAIRKKAEWESDFVGDVDYRIKELDCNIDKPCSEKCLKRITGECEYFE